jgi:DNA helicase II / ATP-dependent DNA helicase PcrA
VSNSPFLQSLNEPQREAVLHTEGPLLIFAGAGSGKTNVLTRRIAYLIREKQVRPYNILAVTFTNKAAREMKERITSLVGDTATRDLWAGTFHSLCARMLRERGKEIGLSSSFVIYDTSDQLSVVKEALKEQNIDEKQYHPRAVLSQISKAKEELKTPKEISAEPAPHPFQRVVASVYKAYEDKLAQCNALDFDDLIMKSVELIQRSSKAKEHYQSRFMYVHCDEFQDTNESQYQLLSLLSAKHRNLCVVGDDDQSIYAFRGANVQIILNFERDFPDARTIKLEQNYRSTKNILDAAHHVVRNNKDRAKKKLWTENVEGELITLIEAPNEIEEAVAVATVVGKQISSGKRTYQDFAVLYRTNAQSRALEEQLINYRIPYKLIGGLRFYERKEIKDLLGYLRVCANPYDGVSLRRIINVPARSIGISTIERFNSFAQHYEISFWDALRRYDEVINIAPRAKKSVAGFVAMIEYFIRQAESKSVSDLVQDILDTTDYIDDLKKESPYEIDARKENIGELLSVAKEFEQMAETEEDRSLLKFLENVSLVADVDSLAADAPAVTLMTLHSAKGLEFPVVLLVGLEEGVFPSARSFDEQADLQEERRLCYVGITRAKEELYLAYAGSRMLFGNVQRNPVSRFISEIPKELYVARTSRPAELDRFSPTTTETQRRSQYVMAPSWTEISRPVVTPTQIQPELGYKLGDKVIHKIFGVGTVVGMSPDGDDTQVTVAYPAPTGIKKLMASFAKLEKINA